MFNIPNSKRAIFRPAVRLALGMKMLVCFSVHNSAQDGNISNTVVRVVVKSSSDIHCSQQMHANHSEDVLLFTPVFLAPNEFCLVCQKTL